MGSPESRTELPSWDRVAALLLVVLALVPFLDVIGLPSTTLDDAYWVGAPTPGQPDWMESMFGGLHKRGYRPVTALTFSLNALLGAWSLRWTDLALHAGVVVGTWALARALLPTGPWALIAPLWVALHPASAQVVPSLARRSYALCTFFACVGYALAAHGATTDRRRAATVAAGALLGLAAGSHEIGFVLALPGAALFWHFRPPNESPRDLVLRALACGWGLLAAGVLRLVMVGTRGGYAVHYVTWLNDRGLPQARVFAEDRPMLVFAAAWTHELFPLTAWGPMPGATLGTAIACAFGIGALLWLALRRRVTALEVGLLWALAVTALGAWSGQWFWRQGYPVAPGLGLAIAGGLHQLWTASPVGRVVAVPLGLALGTVVLGSPQWRGTSDRTERLDAAHDRLQPALAEIEGPADLFVISPLKAREGPFFLRRVRALAEPRGIVVRSLAHQASLHDPDDWPPADGLLQLAPGSFLTRSARRADAGPGRVDLSRLPDGPGPAWILFEGPEGLEARRLPE